MGTDIHMACEIRRDGKWRTLKERVFKNAWFREDSYNLLGMLADVRNGTGFAGCRIREPFVPISKPKGLPKDMCKDTEEYISHERTASYLTLSELERYAWTRLHRNYVVVDEGQYRDYVMRGNNPEDLCVDVCGPGIVHLKEPEMVDLIMGKRERKPGETYYTACYFKPKTYAECSGGFYDEVLPVLRSLVPAGGTGDDVRIVFDFDS